MGIEGAPTLQRFLLGQIEFGEANSTFIVFFTNIAHITHVAQLSIYKRIILLDHPIYFQIFYHYIELVRFLYFFTPNTRFFLY